MISRHSLIAALLFSLLFVTGCDNSSTGSDNDDLGPIPSDNLEAARVYAMENEDGGPRGQALVIWHDDEILLEEYRDDFNGQQLHSIWSGSKSFAGLLAAIAVRNELFTFDTTLGELIPDWDPESERGKITIRQLLNLTSGIETAPVGDFNQKADEWLSADMVYERGSTFNYGPTPFYILSWIFVEVFEINPITYLNEHLFLPLGVAKGEWSTVDLIYPNLAFGGNFSALDWLQIGILLMNGGILNGNEIIPNNLMDQLLTPSQAARGYGITFWLNKPIGPSSDAMRIPGVTTTQTTQRVISDIMPDDLFMMSGAFGQKLYICPSLNLVIVRYGIVVLGNLSDDEFFSRLLEGVDQADLQ